MRATIVITTKNRRDELERTLNSCVEQTARPEILVIDDGSTDGTTTFVKSSYPTIQLVRDEKSQGLIAQRNNAAEIVNSDVIVSIDDDATFSANNIVANVMKQFTDPRVAAIAIHGMFFEKLEASAMFSFTKKKKAICVFVSFKEDISYALERGRPFIISNLRNAALSESIFMGNETSFFSPGLTYLFPKFCFIFQLPSLTACCGD